MEFYRWLQNINVAQTTMEDKFNPWPQVKLTLRKWFRALVAVVMAVGMFVMPIQTVNAAPNIQFTDSGQALGSSNSWDVSLADVDGDGDTDAFVANAANKLNKVWLNNLDRYISRCDNTAPNNLVVNGSFEKPVVPAAGYDFKRQIEGWNLVEGIVIEVDSQKIANAYDGSQFVDLDSVATQQYGKTTTKISQKIATQAGKTYKLSFAFEGNDNPAITEHDKLNIHWGSELVEALDIPDSLNC